jgi:hypothetical protein
VKAFFANIIARRANKFVAAALAELVTLVAAHGVPLDQWVSDATLHGIGSAVATGLVYLISNRS